MSQICQNATEAFYTTTFLIIAIILFLFGIAYNWLVGWLEKKGWENGITAGLVVIGVAVTVSVGVVPIFGLNMAVYLSAIFLVSGIPMICGAIWRYLTERDENRQRIIKALDNALSNVVTTDETDTSQGGR